MEQIDHLEHFDHQECPFKGHFWQKGAFRAKSHEIKVVGNAILKTFYFITFFPGMHPLAVNDILLSSP